MAGLSDEQLKLVRWRLEHGETVQGRPFYDDPKFAKFCEVANEAEKKSQAGEVGKMFGKPLSPEVVEEMHFAFIYAEDGAADALNAWKRFCDMLKETEKILGAIDAPRQTCPREGYSSSC
ncbi:Phosphatidylinositol 4-phosphate 5-kinase 4 [Durusdinium trenchii]|uniref:Phosphatidylinositol 4-phosphate 5-kinase 4 n=1 Tax=Durusdinium trenchii TaxID=1381693 RepID=A0ABP0LZI3_9DINO